MTKEKFWERVKKTDYCWNSGIYWKELGPFAQFDENYDPVAEAAFRRSGQPKQPKLTAFDEF